MPKPTSPFRKYETFIEQAIENYTSSIPRSELLKVGDEAVANLEAKRQFALTEDLLWDEVDKIILQRLELPSYREWRSREALQLAPALPFVNAAGVHVPAIDPSAAPVLLLAEEVSKELIALLARSPELLHQLSPRKFEEVIADLLSRSGAEVTLTPTSRDGGRDIVANISTPLGAFLCLIECKRYAPDRPVGVQPVRELFGVVAHERVTQGVLVTTSQFTRPARQFAERVPHRLSLKAYEDIVAWLDDASAAIIGRVPSK